MAISPAVDTATFAPPTRQITARTAQLSFKAAVVESSVDVHIGVKEQPLGLIYKSAVEKLNERLEPELGPEAIQQAADSGMDFSPEAVAERIVSFATGFFGAYQENHTDQETGEQLSGFMGLIRDAIEQGFAEAREILDGLGVLQGEIEDNADRTYDLVQERLDAFEQGTAERLEIG